MSAHHADDGLPAPVSTLAEDPPADGRQAPPSGVVVGEDGRARPPWAARDPLLREYYDTEWGLPVTDERGLFERLVLEAFQSGLSWRTVLAKRPRFRQVFAGVTQPNEASMGLSGSSEAPRASAASSAGSSTCSITASRRGE